METSEVRRPKPSTPNKKRTSQRCTCQCTKKKHLHKPNKNTKNLKRVFLHALRLIKRRQTNWAELRWAGRTYREAKPCARMATSETALQDDEE